MKLSRSKRVVIALSLALAFALLVHRRVLPLVVDFSSYHDGARGFASASDPELRHFAWQPARELARELAGEPIDGAGREASLAWSRDGRWLAFAAGESGERELFVAELEGGAVRDVRSLGELNSASDECAPAFGENELYFASNRPGGAGGFDLYACDWNDGIAGEARALDGVNTAADELDPAPRRGELVFASNRERDGRRDFDLFSRATGGEVGALSTLNSPRDEREPRFSHDGRSLCFASDRDGSFDLFRAFEHELAWLSPEALEPLNTTAHERAPALDADGVRISFTREPSDGAANDLWLARVSEVARIPGGPSGWYDLALAGALVALALLAWLSGRWSALDFLYKCFLASLVIHLLLMLWFRYLHPDKGSYGAPERGNGTFRVRLIPDDQRARSLREQSGELRMTRNESAPAVERAELERTHLENASAQAVPEAAGELDIARAELAPSPGRLEVDVERPASSARVADAAVAAPAESFERREAGARSIELAPGVAHERSVAEATAPQRDSRTLATAPEPSVPSAGIVVAQRDRASELDAPTRFAPGVEGPSSARAVPEPHVGGPAGEVARRTARAAPSTELAAQSFGASRDGGADSTAAPERTSGSSGVLESSPREVAASAAGALTSQRSGDDASAAPFQSSGVAPSGGASERTVGPALASPREEHARGELAQAPAAALPAPRELGTSRASSGDGDGPQPLARGTSSQVASAAPPASAPASAAPLIEAPRAREVDAPRRPVPLADTPYRNRFGPEKEVALREMGGTQETERAVALGLRYLASRQRRDGGFGDAGDRSDKYRDVGVGKTGLALLAFLGAGHTAGSGTEHSRVVERAIAHLVRSQDETTGHFGDSEAYSHGIATYALAECFAITRDETLRAPLERAVAQIVRHQLTRGGARRAGGWSYFYPDGATFDSFPRASITAWQVMALESARLGGLEVPDATFDAAARFLASSWDDALGAFRYNHDPSRLNSGYPTLPGSTPAALFALSLLGEDLASPRWSRALDFVTTRAPRSFAFAGDDEFVSNATGNLYFWYYASLALLRRGGDAWERWNEALKATLLPAQRGDGSWEPIDIYCRYAGDDDGDAVYATSMCVLTLEVYYRYFTPLLRVK